MHYVEESVFISVVGGIVWLFRRMIVRNEKRRADTHQRTLDNEKRLDLIDKDIEYLKEKK